MGRSTSCQHEVQFFQTLVYNKQNTAVARQVFSERIVNIWNKLSVDFSSLACFIFPVKHVDLSKYIRWS